jgi:hypothetical protein
MRGEVLHEWVSPDVDDRLFNSEPIYKSRGHILALRERFEAPELPPLGTRIVTELDWDGNVVFELAGPEALGPGRFAGFHHDMERLPNGNTLVLCAILVDVPEISPQTLIDDCLIEVDPAGDIVWQWFTFEHFDEFGFSEEAKALISGQGGDWARANAVSVLPGNAHRDSAFDRGNIMVSYRSVNAIVIIDRGTGEIAWKIGPDDNLTIGQHQPTMIRRGRAGAGNILVFDNGGGWGYPAKFRSWSRVAEIDPNVKNEIWQYTAQDSGLQIWSFFTPIISGAQRLRNGNTLIVEGTKGRIFEVTNEGEIAWEYMTPFFTMRRTPSGVFVKSPNIFRAYRLPFRWRPR